MSGRAGAGSSRDRPVKGDDMVARHQGIVKRDDRIVGCDQRAVDEDDVTARAALVIVQPVALGRIDVMLGEGARIWRRSVRACFGGIGQYCGASRFIIIPVREKGLT